MPRLTRLAAVPLVALGLACGGIDPTAFQGQPPPDPSWVGTWQAPGRTLTIHPDGMVDLEDSGAASSHITAPAQRFTAEEIAVGLGPFVKTLHVDQPPAAGEAGWTMVVDGTTLMRVSADLAPATEAPPPAEAPPAEAPPAEAPPAEAPPAEGR